MALSQHSGPLPVTRPAADMRSALDWTLKSAWDHGVNALHVETVDYGIDSAQVKQHHEEEAAAAATGAGMDAAYDEVVRLKGLDMEMTGVLRNLEIEYIRAAQSQLAPFVTESDYEKAAQTLRTVHRHHGIVSAKQQRYRAEISAQMLALKHRDHPCWRRLSDQPHPACITQQSSRQNGLQDGLRRS